MKQSMFFTGLLALFLLMLPQLVLSAASKTKSDIQSSVKHEESVKGKVSKHASFKEKISRKVDRFKQKVRKWKASILDYLPTGKLMTSLVFLLLSIVFFAIGGLTTLGVLFNLLGSAAVILALVFFVLWLTERAKTPAN